MRTKSEILWRVYMTRIHAKRDGVVTPKEEAILRQLEFKVTNQETGQVELTNALDFDGGLHLIPDDQNDLTL